jgi:tRNA nucleotidyltransferase (CCA-adding enzyme)
LPYGFMEAVESYRFNRLPWEWDSDYTDVGALGNQLLQLPLIADHDLRWASLLSGFGMSEEDCSAFCRILRLSVRRANRISGVVGMNDRMIAPTVEAAKDNWIYTVLHYGHSLSIDWLNMAEAGGQSVEVERSWLDELAATSIAELQIRGDELSSLLNKAPGPWIARYLQYLLEKVALGQLPNERNALLAESKLIIENNEL